jgi:hypothetical protein
VTLLLLLLRLRPGQFTGTQSPDHSKSAQCQRSNQQQMCQLTPQQQPERQQHQQQLAQSRRVHWQTKQQQQQQQVVPRVQQIQGWSEGLRSSAGSPTAKQLWS